MPLHLLLKIALGSSRIQQIINSFASSLHIELQQRGVEFSQLFGKYTGMREALLERMPPMEVVRQPGNDIQANGDMEDLEAPVDSPIHQHDSVRNCK